jgi:hypothetical protein
LQEAEAATSLAFDAKCPRPLTGHAINPLSEKASHERCSLTTAAQQIQLSKANSQRLQTNGNAGYGLPFWSVAPSTWCTNCDKSMGVFVPELANLYAFPQAFIARNQFLGALLFHFLPALASVTVRVKAASCHGQNRGCCSGNQDCIGYERGRSER